MQRRPYTVSELIRALQTLVRLDPANAEKLVLCTAEAGHVHEYVHGIASVGDTTVTLGEAD